MINHTINKGVTHKGLTLYSGTTVRKQRYGAIVATFTGWFESMKDLEEAHPEFKGAEVRDLGLLNL